MTQSTDLTLAPAITGAAQRTELNDIIAAIASGHAGAARPAYLPANGMWVKTVSASVFEIYYYTGSADIKTATIDTTLGTYVPSGQIAGFANGSIAKTGSFSFSNTEYGKIIDVNASSASIVATIPVESSLLAGWYVIIQRTDSSNNTVTITGTSRQTINGLTTYTLTKQYESAIIIKSNTTSNFLALKIPSTAGLAPLDSPTFTGNATAPTVATNDNSTKIATTANVEAKILSKANLASPTFTGDVNVPLIPYTDDNLKAVNSTWVRNFLATQSGLIKVIWQTNFTTSGTYIPHPNMVSCFIQVQGSGGGSGFDMLNGGTTGVGPIGNELIACEAGSNGISTSTSSLGGAGGIAYPQAPPIGYDLGGTIMDGQGGGSANTPSGDGGSSFLGKGGTGGAPATPLIGFGNVRRGYLPTGYGAGAGGIYNLGVASFAGGGAGGYRDAYFLRAAIGASKTVYLGVQGRPSATGYGVDGGKAIVMITEYCTA